MPTSTTTFSITIGQFPVWFPDWAAPGVIKEIPNSSLQAAIQANGWGSSDTISGGTNWPEGLYQTWSGGTVAYVDNQPYYCISGGGHASFADNSIYAFGPLFGQGSDAPSWSRLGQQTLASDVRTCRQRYADGRPSSRHTAGDFSYGVGSDGKPRIVMLWQNSSYCANGGTSPSIDVFDIDAREWDGAKSTPISHPSHNLNPTTHSPSVFHPHTGLWYAKGKGAASDSFGSYDPVSKTFREITYSGQEIDYDSAMCTMGPRDYIFFVKSSGAYAGRINVRTGAGESWGRSNFPSGSSKTAAYDSVQDRIYVPTTGTTGDIQSMPPGSKSVAWIDASASSNPSWQSETLNGDTPDRQQSPGTFGRWAFVPELRGFLLNNAWDSSIYLFRISE